MQRREFIKKASAVSAALACLPTVAEGKVERDTTDTDLEPQIPGRVRQPDIPPHPIRGESRYRFPPDGSDEYLPKQPVSVETLVPDDQRILPMLLADRLQNGRLPRRGFCSIVPGKAFQDTLLSGNGSTYVEVAGHPFSERLSFHHEGLLAPWRRPFEAPRVAHILPDVRKLLLAGKYREGTNLAYEAMSAAGLPMNTHPHPTIPAFGMDIEVASLTPVRNYLRTVDFETSEIRIAWSDPRGEWQRSTFVSRTDKIVVQQFRAPLGQSITTTISLQNPIADFSVPEYILFQQDCTEQRMIFTGRFDPDINNSGYACITRVIRDGGTSAIENNKLLIKGARSLMLVTRIEWFSELSADRVAALEAEVMGIQADYAHLLERSRQGQAPIFDRVSINFGGAAQHAMSIEELLEDQRTLAGYNPALLEKIFDMGRYWLMLSCGKYPVQPIIGEVNINVNLQVAHGICGNLPEAMASYFDWIESLLPDCRKNAANIFGARGAVFPIMPAIGMGVSFSYASTLNLGIFPHTYWISAGGWCYRPFWDHYLVTGDLEFLRGRVLPGLKELALFYEDFLTVTDANGNYIFVPSFSPENWPLDAEPPVPSAWPAQTTGLPASPPTPLVINADMDIMVCREVLTHLIQASEILGGAELGNIPKWKHLLDKMPPYLLTSDGALKEWSWPTLAENYDQRHVSHLYGAWPGDEIDPGRNPKLAKAALLADRKRGPSNSSAHGLCHRALAGARLKDSYLVNFELKQLLEQGYVGTSLRTSHNPYRPGPMPDAQGGIPAILMEMLLYSRPGVIELLPALPSTLRSGAIRGVLARTFVKVDEFEWNLDAGSLQLKLTSSRDQVVMLMVWHGIRSITASPGVLRASAAKQSHISELHLPANQTVTVKVTILSQAPLDWIAEEMRG